MSEITLALEHPSLGCGEIIARYDLSEIQEKAYQQGRADVIEEFVRPILNGTLHTICRMIASGDIPKDVYQKWLSDTPIGFMTPLEIYAEILNEQLKEQKNE